MSTVRGRFLLLLADGVVGGIVAGVTLVIAEMATAIALGLPATAPIRLISSISLGPSSLSSAFPLVQVILGFITVHFALSAVYGGAFTILLAFGKWFRASPGLVLLLGFIYGTVVSLINLLVVPLAAFSQFTVIDLLWEGILPHAVFFGLPLAGYLLLVSSKH